MTLKVPLNGVRVCTFHTVTALESQVVTPIAFYNFFLFSIPLVFSKAVSLRASCHPPTLTSSVLSPPISGGQMPPKSTVNGKIVRDLSLLHMSQRKRLGLPLWKTKKGYRLLLQQLGKSCEKSTFLGVSDRQYV